MSKDNLSSSFDKSFCILRRLVWYERFYWSKINSFTCLYFNEGSTLTCQMNHTTNFKKNDGNVITRINTSTWLLMVSDSIYCNVLFVLYCSCSLWGSCFCLYSFKARPCVWLPDIYGKLPYEFSSWNVLYN